MAIKINGQDLLKRFINGQEIVRVYKNGGQIRPETVPPVFSDYLCFTAEESNSTVSLASGNAQLETSADKENRNDYTTGSTITLSNVGDKVYRRNKSPTYSWTRETCRFTMTGSIAASGDIGSLMCRDSVTTITAWRAFYKLFGGCTALTVAPKLSATVLTGEQCYESMFEGCTNLTSAPALPATTLSGACYLNMFEGCISLTTASALPATTAEPNCYKEMFKGCTSLIVAPQLPATTVEGGCYSGMFEGCTSLTTPPPILPAMIASSDSSTDGCYERMFYGCSSLLTAPQMSATTLGGSSCNHMFAYCTSLTTPPALPATTLESGLVYYRMFRGCSSLTALPALPAIGGDTDYGYYGKYGGMFRDCPLIKISDTQTGEYQNPYRVPSSGTTALSDNINMFVGTGGPVTAITTNTTYYTPNTIIS